MVTSNVIVWKGDPSGFRSGNANTTLKKIIFFLLSYDHLQSGALRCLSSSQGKKTCALTILGLTGAWLDPVPNF